MPALATPRFMFIILAGEQQYGKDKINAEQAACHSGARHRSRRHYEFLQSSVELSDLQHTC